MSAATVIACVVGTRPEAIKMAPVIEALRASTWAQCKVIVTAQHRSLLDGPLAGFNIVPDIDLDLMTASQTPAELSSRMLTALMQVFSALNPAAVLAQGDTVTVFTAALAAFFGKCPFGHVEAGLRTHNLLEPFPEEGMRQMVTRISRWHFAPTAGAADNLRQEGVEPSRIHVTGNTGIDTLFSTGAGGASGGGTVDSGERLILLTAHRRENFGAPLEQIFTAVRQLADAYADVKVVYPVHPNPNVKEAAARLLGAHPRIVLCEPLDYFEFVDLMRRCYLVLTDSGGVQEEAPALCKPVLVLRERTERPEAVAAGVAAIVGTDAGRIFDECSRLLTDPVHYRSMASGGSPYGDGRASGRIELILRGDLAAGRAVVL